MFSWDVLCRADGHRVSHWKGLQIRNYYFPLAVPAQKAISERRKRRNVQIIPLFCINSHLFTRTSLFSRLFGTPDMQSISGLVSLAL